MNKISMVIWSRDRAPQVECLLNSIYHNIPNWFDINLMYVATNDEFEEGYDKLEELYKDVKIWQKGRLSGIDGKMDLIQSIQDYDYFSICCDDNYIWRNPGLDDISQLLDDVGCFSLRLGLNTLIQDHFQKVWQPPLNRYIDEGETISWNAKDYHPHYNFGYLFSTDLHIYKTKQVLPLIKEIEFNRTNQLESKLALHYRDKINPIMRSFKESISVNVPLNNFSQITQSEGPTVEYLNQEFLKGKKLRFKEGQKPIGCHEQLDWELI